MLHDSLNLVEGSRVINLTIDSGTTFPTLPSLGELFFRTDLGSLFTYNGSTWLQLASGSGSFSVTGDVTGTLTNGSGSLDLVNTGVTAATYGAANSTFQITIDAKGRITGISQTAITIDGAQVGSGTMANDRISQSSVTQHQAALTILESQITNGLLLARVTDNETITGTWDFQQSPTAPTPSSSSQVATKGYVDGLSDSLSVPTIVSGTSATAVPNGHYVMTNTSTTTITLPAAPTAGMIVWITNATSTTTHVIARNGARIMALLEDMVLDIANINVQLRYIDSNNGWRMM